jgi:hypothetical protein
MVPHLAMIESILLRPDADAAALLLDGDALGPPPASLRGFSALHAAAIHGSGASLVQALVRAGAPIGAPAALEVDLACIPAAWGLIDARTAEALRGRVLAGCTPALAALAAGNLSTAGALLAAGDAASGASPFEAFGWVGKACADVPTKVAVLLQLLEAQESGMLRDMSVALDRLFESSDPLLEGLADYLSQRSGRLPVSQHVLGGMLFCALTKGRTAAFVRLVGLADPDDTRAATVTFLVQFTTARGLREELGALLSSPLAPRVASELREQHCLAAARHGAGMLDLLAAAGAHVTWKCVACHLEDLVRGSALDVRSLGRLIKMAGPLPSHQQQLEELWQQQGQAQGPLRVTVAGGHLRPLLPCPMHRLLQLATEVQSAAAHWVQAAETLPPVPICSA